MDLKQFKSWKLLYEDEDLCFSKAVNDIDKTDVFFITFFQPEKMSIATKPRTIKPKRKYQIGVLSGWIYSSADQVIEASGAAWACSAGVAEKVVSIGAAATG